ncbi:DUF58 domain-containing protein [Cellulomonas aerilata]|uniref:DUF58 domain-containing protein n=1 Tax=Cellulomonas aerilata TaxID=515326 RepID=A0A512D977_9CELL|nr:DUF58 domain-containing protein [Cellulomonas aerilata]GEO32840.1 hypothetical protein CAE01nite_05650 [Cellulomonas aerilata]
MSDRPVSGLGWTVAAAGLGLAVLGVRLGWVEAASAGAVLLAALAVAAALTVGRSTYAVELELSGRRVRVGERAVGRIAVRNTSGRRLLPARVELPVGRGSADFPLPSLGPGDRHEDVFAVPTSRRGVVVVGPVRSVRGDPWGLVRRRLDWTDPVDLYVHPLTHPLPGAAQGALRDLEGQATRVVSDSDLAFHALREYVPGDDRRTIHWKATARHGDLMVRQFEDTRRSHTAVALATDPDGYADADELELAISVVASLGVAALRDEREVTVLAGGEPLRAGTPQRLLDDCASLAPAPGQPGPADLAAWVRRQVPHASVAILVVGSVPTPAELRAYASAVPAGTRTLVLACDRSAPTGVRTAGTTTLARVAALGDLPRTLRAAVAA